MTEKDKEQYAKKMHSNLTNKGYNLGEYDVFRKAMQDEKNRKNFYKHITERGENLGDYDMFSGIVSYADAPVVETDFKGNPMVSRMEDAPSMQTTSVAQEEKVPFGSTDEEKNYLAQSDVTKVALGSMSPDEYKQKHNIDFNADMIKSSREYLSSDAGRAMRDKFAESNNVGNTLETAVNKQVDAVDPERAIRTFNETKDQAANYKRNRAAQNLLDRVKSPILDEASKGIREQVAKLDASQIYNPEYVAGYHKRDLDVNEKIDAVLNGLEGADYLQYFQEAGIDKPTKEDINDLANRIAANFYGEVASNEKVDNYVEYIAKKIANNSIIGQLATIGKYNDPTVSAIQQQQMAEYEKGLPYGGRFVGEAAPVIADYTPMKYLGAGSKWIAEKIGTKLGGALLNTAKATAESRWQYANNAMMRIAREAASNYIPNVAATTYAMGNYNLANALLGGAKDFYSVDDNGNVSLNIMKGLGSAYVPAAEFALVTIPGNILSNVSKNRLQALGSFAAGTAISGGYMSYENAANIVQAYNEEHGFVNADGSLKDGAITILDLSWNDIEAALGRGYTTDIIFKLQHALYDRKGFMKQFNERQAMTDICPKWQKEWGLNINKVAETGEISYFMEHGKFLDNGLTHEQHIARLKDEFNKIIQADDYTVPANIKESIAFALTGRKVYSGMYVDSNYNDVAAYDARDAIFGTQVIEEKNGKFKLRALGSHNEVLFEETFDKKEDADHRAKFYQGTADYNNRFATEKILGMLTKAEVEAAERSGESYEEASKKKRDILIGYAEGKTGKSREEIWEAFDKKSDRRTPEGQAIVDDYLKELGFAGIPEEKRAAQEAVDSNGYLWVATDKDTGREVYVVRDLESGVVTFIDTATGDKKVSSEDKVMDEERYTFDEVNEEINKTPEQRAEEARADMEAEQKRQSENAKEELKNQQQQYADEQQRRNAEAPFFVRNDDGTLTPIDNAEKKAGSTDWKVRDFDGNEYDVPFDKLVDGDDVRAEQQRVAEENAKLEAEKLAKEQEQKKAELAKQQEEQRKKEEQSKTSQQKFDEKKKEVAPEEQQPTAEGANALEQMRGKLSGEQPKKNGKFVGLVRDNTEDVDSVTLSQIDAIAKRMGVEVRFVDEVDGGDSNASYENGVILIEKGNKNPLKALVGHEILHSIKQNNPASYDDFIDSLYAAVGENQWNAAIKRVKKLYGGNIGDRAAAEEVVADFAGSILNNTRRLDRFTKAADKGTIASFKSWLDDFYHFWTDSIVKDKIVGGDIDGSSYFMLTEEQYNKLSRKLERAYQRAESKEFLEEDGYNVTDDAVTGDVLYSKKYSPQTKEDMNNRINDIVNITGRKKSEVKRWINSEMTLAAIFGDENYREYLDYKVDDTQSFLKKNSDYPQGSIDFNNICRKRIPATYIWQQVQHDNPNRILTAQDLADMINVLKENNIEVPCAPCFVEDRRQKLGEIANQFISDISNGFGEYAVNAKKKRIANKINKLIAKYNIDEIKNILDIDKLVTLDGNNELREKYPELYEAFVTYNNARGQQSGRLFLNYAEYKREILDWNDKKVKKVNDEGGLRIFSTSDFEAHHLLDIVQIVQDCAVRGIKIQGYTKVPSFARAMANTGAKINMSLIPSGIGYHMEGDKIVLDFDPIEGINVNDPDFKYIGDSNPNVGTIIIGINDAHIRACMTDPFIDYIIPFHTGLETSVRKTKGIGDWQNYKLHQTEKKDGIAVGHKDAVNIYTDVIDDAIAKGEPMKNKKHFVEKYLQVCREKGYVPKYAKFLNQDKNGNYVYTEGYHKFLVDFKLFDKNGKMLDFNPVEPKFDDELNRRIVDEYVKDESIDKDYSDVINQVKAKLGLNGGSKLSKKVAESNREIDDESYKQNHGSAATSINQVPMATNYLVNKGMLKSGTTNLDMGGGKYDTATNFLADNGVENLVFDPFNREAEHNKQIAERVKNEGVETVTCNNVLNVIDTEGARKNVILQCAKALKPGGTAYFSVYEGSKDGDAKETKRDSWQNNKRTAEYLDDIEEFFNDVSLKHGIITAREPKNTDGKSVWQFNGEDENSGQLRFSKKAKADNTDSVNLVWKNGDDESKPARTFDVTWRETGKTSREERDPRYGVGKRMGGVYFHKNYAEDVVPEDVLSKALEIVPSDFKYNCMYYDEKTPNLVRFDEAPDFDSAREPIPGDMIVVDTSTGNIVPDSRGNDIRHSNQIWHHKWEWVKDDYKGFDVQDSFDWSVKWKDAFDKQPLGIGSKRVWDEALNSVGLPVENGILPRNPGESFKDYAQRVLDNHFGGNNPTDPNDNGGKKFSMKADKNHPVFYSNAERFVEDSKQEKATGEQWLKMIQNGGGLKAGEDKWIGLSSWLNEHKGDKLTKQDVLDYVADHKIKIEDVNYSNYDFSKFGIDDDTPFRDIHKIVNQKMKEVFPNDYDGQFADRFVDAFDIRYKNGDIRPSAWQEEKAAMLYENDTKDFLKFNDSGRMKNSDWLKVNNWAKKKIMEAFGIGDYNPINSTRSDFMTKGLDNHKEIALVVPTIEPYNTDDEIHFGDAGGGRAVAWIRFGETTDTPSLEEMSGRNIMDELEKKYGSADAIHKMTPEDKAKRFYANYTIRKDYVSADEMGEQIALEESPEVALMFHDMVDAVENASKVLVIDEIQSKRHDDARKNGYSEGDSSLIETKKKYEDSVKALKDYKSEMNRKYGNESEDTWPNGMSKEEQKKFLGLMEYSQECEMEYLELGKELRKKVPDAPFDKNWDELAMKRMLAYAAENGFDKIAWTTGDQQQKRYGVSVPKFLYDDVMPRYFNKYGKKYGVKVNDITLPNVESDGRVMHSIDITPEMKESITKNGQPMFSKKAKTPSEFPWSKEEKKRATTATFFSGGGLLEQGLRGAIDPKIAVEIDPKIAGVYKTNNGDHIVVSDVTKFDVDKAVKDVDGGHVSYFHASPVCKNFSNMKTDMRETPVDIETATATADAIEKMRPEVFTLENVPNYRNSEAMQIITDKLESLGYDVDVAVYNAADYGAPTSRKRLILRAAAPGLTVPPRPAHTEKSKGWFSAVEDLIKEAQPANVPDWIVERAERMGLDIAHPKKPLYVAYGTKGGDLAYAYADEVAPAITARGGDERIFMPNGEVLEVNPEMLARLSGLPMDYKIPAWNKSLAHTIIGNGIPVQLSSAVIAPMVESRINNYEAKKKITAKIEDDYKAAVDAEDYKKAAKLFNKYVLSQADDNIVPVLYGEQYRGNGHDKVAKLLKEENKAAIAMAVEAMAPKVPKDAVLIPIPSRTGKATDTKALAEALSKATGAPMMDILEGLDRESAYEAKTKKHKLTPEMMGMHLTAEIPDGKTPIFVDNVIDRGTTGAAAVRAANGGIVLAYAKTQKPNKYVDIKSAEPITYDSNGRLIPMSERFNPNNPDIRYSIKPTRERKTGRPLSPYSVQSEAQKRIAEMQDVVRKIMDDKTWQNIPGVKNKKPVEEIVVEMERFVRERLNKEIGSKLGSMQIKSILKNLRDAATSEHRRDAMRSIEDVRNAVRKTQELLNDAQMAIDLGEMQKMMKMGTKKKNQQGIEVGTKITKEYAKVFDGIKSTFAGMFDDSTDHTTHYALNEQTLNQEVAEANTRIADALANGENPKEEDLMAVNEGQAIRRSLINVEETMADADNAKADWVKAEKELDDFKQTQEYIYAKKNEHKKLTPAQTALLQKERLLTQKLWTAQDNFLQKQREVANRIYETNQSLKNFIGEGKEEMRLFREAQNDYKKQLIGFAMEDYKSKRTLAEGESGVRGEIAEKAQEVWDAINSTAYSLDYLLGNVRNHYSKEGKLYEHFFLNPETSIITAAGNKADGIHTFGRRLDNAVADIFGRSRSKGDTNKNFLWLKEDSEKELGVKVNKLLTMEEAREYNKNFVGGRDDYQEYVDEIEVENMTKGNALYAWLCWQQPDGRMKMLQQGYTDKSIKQIENALGGEYLQYGMFMTDVLLPELREKRYNPRHEQMYGTSMANNIHYFPLKIDKNDLRPQKGIDDKDSQFMPSTITPQLIARKANTAKLDIVRSNKSLGTNALDVIVDYGEAMEQWYNMAPVIADFNVLHSCRALKNVMENERHGSFNQLMRAAQVATESQFDDPNKSKILDTINKSISTYAKGAIGYRLFTACKQITSYPAFYSYSNDPRYIAELTANIGRSITFGNGMFENNISWAYDNLPLFRQRMRNGDMGIEGMDESFGGELVRKYGEWGMMPNRIVDMATIAAGARAVYNQAFRKYKDQGYSKKEARKRAVIESQIVYNESQQSSVAAFSSDAQKSHDALMRSFALFRNASIGYGRMLRSGVKDMVKAVEGDVLDKDGNPTSAGYRLRKLLSGAFDATMFGAILPTIWGYAGATSLYGNDDETEEKNKMLLISNFLGLTTDGTILGSPVSAYANGYEYAPYALFKDLDYIVSKVKNDGITDIGMITYAAKKAALYGTGFNFDTWDNIKDGVVDIYDDISTDELNPTTAIDFMLMFNVNKTDRVRWAKRLFNEYGPVKFAQAYDRAAKVDAEQRKNKEVASSYFDALNHPLHKRMEEIETWAKEFEQTYRDAQNAKTKEESEEYVARIKEMMNEEMFKYYTSGLNKLYDKLISTAATEMKRGERLTEDWVYAKYIKEVSDKLDKLDEELNK